MSENRNCDYSKYDAMTTEALEEILRLDASAPDGEDSDTELLLYVMEVLANRRKIRNITGKTALESWNSFQKNYLDEECAEDVQEPKKNRTATPWLRRMIAAAAVIVLVICLPLSAQAFGWRDIWNIFARWAKETFSFVTEESADVQEPDTKYRDELSSLWDLLENSNQDTSIIPTWIPDGYVVEKTEKSINPVKEIYRAFYTNGDKELRIRIQNYISTDVQNIEIEEGISEIYSVSEIDYYILENLEQIRAVWIVDSYECIISGDISIEELKQMINSIGKG